MRKFITETLQVLLPAQMPGTRSDRGCNGGAAAFRCALLALLVLGLLRGIGRAQEPLVITPGGDANFAGNVSIAKKLTVTGGANVPGNVDIGTLNFGSSLGDKISLYGQTGGSNYGFSIADHALQIHASASDAAIAFGYKSGMTFTEIMRIAGTGNVGIGTNVTGQKLTVAGTGYFSGNVGIGKEPTTTDKLSVDGPASFSGLLVGNNTLIGSKENPFLRSDGVNVVLNAADAGKVYLGFDQGGDIVLSKNVGIRTTDPKAQLDVNGDVRVRKNLYVYGNVIYYDSQEQKKWIQLWGRASQWEGWTPASAPSELSDLRLKSGVQSIPSALDKIRGLRGVTFRWNEQALQYLTKDIETTLSAGPEASDEDNRKLWQAERDKRYKDLSTTNVGVLAQDVEAVLPQAVTTDASGYKSVNYTELIPLVIEALKEEDKISQEQTRTIASQQTEIQRLTVANNAAQQQLSELQEVKQKLGYLEASVNKLLAAGLPGDKDKLASAVERPAGDHPSGSE